MVNVVFFGQWENLYLRLVMFLLKQLRNILQTKKGRKMLIQRGYKYRILPTKEQEESLLQCGGNTRFLWNYVLKVNQDYYKETGKFKFYHELAVSLPKLREEYTFLKESFSQSLQMTLRQFDKALKDSFKKEKGFPFFKKKMLLNDSFTCPQAWRLGKGLVFIPKIVEVKVLKHEA